MQKHVATDRLYNIMQNLSCNIRNVILCRNKTTTTVIINMGNKLVNIFLIYIMHNYIYSLESNCEDEPVEDAAGVQSVQALKQ